MFKKLIKNIAYFFFKKYFQTTKLFETFKNEFYTKYLLNFVTKGFNCRMNGFGVIKGDTLINIGNNVHFGKGLYIDGRGGVIIGNNTHISREVIIYSQSHNHTKNILPYGPDFIKKTVSIEDNVWIGYGVKIAPGVTIGKNSIIGIGCTINSDIPDNSIVLQGTRNSIKNRDVKKFDHYYIGGKNGNPIETTNFKKNIFDFDSDNRVFIVGTGRSGSQSIANYLSFKEHQVLHEFRHPLLVISNNYEYGFLSKSKAVQIIKNLYSLGVINRETEFYGESDQKISNLIDIYEEAIGPSKFIHLKRNPIEFVSSAYMRGWYEEAEVNEMFNRTKRNNKYSSNRLLPSKIPNLMDIPNNDPFELNCWYYSYIQEKVSHSFSNLPNNRKLELRLEDIDHNIETLHNFTNFNYERGNPFPSSNKAKKKGYTPYDYSQWTKSQKQVFEKWCGKYID
jgi:acetyltransferase-like isoleucine patch superfamily enzyme